MSLELDPFKRLLRQRCGLVFDGVGERRLAAVLAERLGSHDARHYLAHLGASADEFREVVNQLTINETYFFREIEQIELLVDVLVPRLASRRAPEAPIRILSAGCSSGEEPYSIAMALLDRFGEDMPRRFTLVGGDIDSAVIARAREARYSEFSFRGVDQALRSRYFDCQHNLYALKASVRDAVVFQELNLLHPAFGAGTPAFDIVFMRNVSIYFDVPIRREIQRNLLALMSADGYLVTGMTETLANDLGVFALVEEGGLYYFRRKGPPVPPPVATAPGRVQGAAARPPAKPYRARSAPAVPPPRPSGALPTFAAVRALVHDERYDAAVPLVNALLAVQPDDKDARLLEAYIHLNRRDFARAASGCARVLEIDAWSVDALFLLGLVEKWWDHRDAAIAWFKQAAYLHRQCWPAHFYLAGLYAAQGDHAAARRAHGVVLQLLADAPDPGIRVVPVGLHPADVRFLCERRLNARPSSSPADGR